MRLIYVNFEQHAFDYMLFFSASYLCDMHVEEFSALPFKQNMQFHFIFKHLLNTFGIKICRQINQ